MTPRADRSPEKLNEASIHIHYEWFMLVSTAALLAIQPWPGWQYSIRCALINSFAVHARALHHLFWPFKPQPRDVLAEDYFPAGTWTPPPHPAILNGLRDDVATAIVHISYERPNAGGETNWPTSKIAVEFDGHLRRFKEDVERRDPALLNDDHWRRDARVGGREHAAGLLHLALSIERQQAVAAAGPVA